ncbi:MAG TPA: VWA domain-containing protein [Terriglobales bacterium]|nr:VWA domain-containing protein [Terriglobales bacterium]
MLNSYRRFWRTLGIFLIPFVLAAGAVSQTQAPPPQDQKDQSIPDAPSAVQPAKPASENPVGQPAQPEPAAPQTAMPSPQDPSAQPAVNPEKHPPINIRTVPEGGATKEDSQGQDEFFKIVVRTNQVVVPVTVKDESGHLVSGLTAKDFTVLENGKKQTLNFFTSDPFALSAAVVLDVGMKDVDLQKVNHTLPALEGAFSEFDELALYVYSNAVTQLSDWGAVGQQLSAALDRVKSTRGQNNGPPVAGGPLGPQGPTINNVPVNPAAPTVYTPVQEAHVMNDAILRAAIDLTRRDKTRRKIIFVISDGREYRSGTSYKDVLKVLLTNNIIVYAIGVGSSAFPGYRQLSKLHIPRLGYTDILPKYVNATGGEVFNEPTRTGIEDAYLQAMGDARNQYTMGYLTHAAPNVAYRDIEVLVNRPSCRSAIRPCVNVYAKVGYYPGK